MTSLLSGPSGDLEYLRTGSGRPSTVFAHGLAGSIATTRPFGSGVPGARTFLHFRGHGASHAAEGEWTYAALAAELSAVAGHVRATRALGVSMGAGAICRLVADEPHRFARLVLVLPALLDRPRHDAAFDRLRAMADLVDERDVDGLAGLLLAEQPEAVRETRDVRRWAQEQARTLAGTPVARALREIPDQVPLDDSACLAAVSAPVLVLAQEDDPAHPVAAAEACAAAFPAAELVVLPPGGVLWGHRARVRELVSGFLGAEPTDEEELTDDEKLTDAEQAAPAPPPPTRR